MADFGVSEGIMLAAVIASTAAAAYSSYASGQNAQAAAKYNSQVAEQQAQQSRDAAKVQAENAAEVQRRQIAQNRAAIGASGVEMSEGSPLLVLMDNASQASLEQSRIKYAGEIGATGNLNTERLLQFQGGNAARAGTFGAGINLLSGVANAGGQYYGRSTRVTSLSAAQPLIQE